MSNNKVAFVGGGNMTRAIAGGLIDSGFPPCDLLISEPAAARRKVLQHELPGCMITRRNDAVAGKAGQIVLAVKPQVLPQVCRELATTVQQSRPVVISIAAGVRSHDIESWLGGNIAVVRVMPNQPALIRKGVSGLYANEQTSDTQRALATEIIAAIGKVVQVSTEADIDTITAISGSGPAYFFLLIDMLIDAGIRLGLDAATAQTLAIETAKGASILADRENEPMKNLIDRVRSPGGTTAAALDSLEADSVRDIFASAITAARQRAVTMADQAHASQV
ncbi:MAG: pyrroline-5-carboxylate reductase [Proteobacteria bacterium]|nr:pyrroline-5-carboxylate reductase [Pseudomonadota bacterium]